MRTDTKILVTGAGGYIGGWIVESLYLQGFNNVRAGIRRWASAARVGRFPIEITLCDVVDEHQVQKAMDGVDVVIHCAYGPRDATVKGTHNILEAALRQGTKKLVHLSTVSVYGKAEGEVDETTPTQLTGSEYGDSKIEAERLCWEYCEKGLPLVVLRPSVVYGPYCKLWIAKFAERLESGQWGIFTEMGDGHCNLIYIQDLISGVMLSIDSAKSVGQAFNMNGSDIISWNDYFRMFNEALALPPLQIISSSRAKRTSGIMAPMKSAARYVLKRHEALVTKVYQSNAAMQKIMKAVEQRMKTSPGDEELSMFGRKAHYSISKAESVLGFVPRFDVRKGLAISVEWLQHEALYPQNPTKQ
jgi:nucleoside-diphosphate-sugar epimerase